MVKNRDGSPDAESAAPGAASKSIPQRKRGQLIVVGHEKGGMGKSALSANLAVACAMQGQDVVLIDTDRSRANAGWGKIRTETAPDLAKVTVIEAPTNPLSTIRDLVERYDVMVVDLAAGDYQNLPALALLSDLLIVPTGVGREVLESTVKVYNTMRALDARHKSGRVPMVCVFNCVRHIPKEEAAARESLANACPDLAVAPQTIYDRKVFRDVSWIGRSILEMPKRDSERAVDEFTGAMRFAFDYVKKLARANAREATGSKDHAAEARKMKTPSSKTTPTRRGVGAEA